MSTVRQARASTMEARALALMNDCIGVKTFETAEVVSAKHLPCLPELEAAGQVFHIAAQIKLATMCMTRPELPVRMRWLLACQEIDKGADIALLAVTAAWAMS